MRAQSGQTTVEWTGIVLLVALALGAVLAVAPRVDGRSFGGFLAHSVVCAARGSCDEGASGLERAYGEADADLLLRYAPGLVYEPGTYTLPVDPRECRDHRCADAPDDRDLDVHFSKRGRVPATAFTHVARSGGETYLQYWLYYPDSTSTVANAAGVWNRVAGALMPRSGDARGTYPGFHGDDWESVQVKIDRSGRAWVRASAHHWYQGCKARACRNQWTPATGWSRVSRGSHAGHIPMRESGGRPVWVPGRGPRWVPVTRSPSLPGLDVRERTTSAAGLRLIPVESLPRDMQFEISPPWRKEVYRDPRSNSTG